MTAQTLSLPHVKCRRNLSFIAFVNTFENYIQYETDYSCSAGAGTRASEWMYVYVKQRLKLA